jgi:hypothetical protein
VFTDAECAFCDRLSNAAKHERQQIPQSFPDVVDALLVFREPVSQMPYEGMEVSHGGQAGLAWEEPIRGNTSSS